MQRYSDIMLRVQAQLTEDQVEGLKALSTTRGLSVAELLRRGADLLLEQAAGESEAERKARALAVVGRFADEASDAAERHDVHLADALGA